MENYRIFFIIIWCAFSMGIQISVSLCMFYIIYIKKYQLCICIFYVFIFQWVLLCIIISYFRNLRRLVPFWSEYILCYTYTQCILFSIKIFTIWLYLFAENNASRYFFSPRLTDVSTAGLSIRCVKTVSVRLCDVCQTYISSFNSTPITTRLG